MPIYENRQNAENRLILSDAEFQSITTGADAFSEIVRLFTEKFSGNNGAVLCCDGWYGVEFREIAEKLQEKLATAGNKDIELIPASGFFKSAGAIAEQKHPWITDEPAFGRVNEGETLADYSDPEAVKAMNDRISSLIASGKAVIVYGPGAAFTDASLPGILAYFDHTADPMLWKMWKGTLIPFETTSARQYNWKEYYYCDFYILQRHKESIIDRAACYAEAIEAENMTLIPGTVYKKILASLVKQPIKQIRTYSPGPWGAYRYRDLWDIPGLKNNAWNRLAGADLALLIELNGKLKFDMPAVNLLKDHAAEFVGAFPAQAYPGLIPVEIWLDDGYFPEAQPAERTSMPIHNHPGTEYVKKHFNEPLGRYETYYIVEAYKGANTHMGFNEEACLEEWEKLCRESWAEKKPIPNWQEFIANWETNVGDLFLIPEGTTHGHGGNQMVLEMDTCGNAAGGEYSFFGYDFMRPTWDDNKKTMTGKPMKMHLERYFEIDKGFRADWVQKNLRARPVVTAWNQEYSRDRYTTLPQMPFEIDRIHFMKRAESSAEGKYLQAATLTVGTSVIIRSKADPSRCCRIERLQCALIPAGFGDYEIINEDYGASTVVFWQLKDSLMQD